MTLPTGRRIRRATDPIKSGGFTLLELILVMAVLLIVLSISAPSLSGFFRGRTLDSETHRFLALTRYAQSRAIAEGVPMVLWLDKDNRSYGLRQETGSGELDRKEIEYALGQDLDLEFEFVLQRRTNLGSGSGASGSRMGGNAAGSSVEFQPQGVTLPNIRFLPDGYITETSPDLIWIKRNEQTPSRGEQDRMAITRSLNRLHYEVQTNKLAYGLLGR